MILCGVGEDDGMSRRKAEIGVDANIRRCNDMRHWQRWYFYDFSGPPPQNRTTYRREDAK